MENTKELRTWLDDMNLAHPLVIAGPCSAETEEQVLKIAHELKDSDVNYFRAGIWKPRTRPGMFEGVGEIGLRWLKKVKEETGMKTCYGGCQRCSREVSVWNMMSIYYGLVHVLPYLLSLCKKLQMLYKVRIRLYW